MASSLLDAMEQPLELALSIMEGRAYLAAKRYLDETPVERLDLTDPMVALAYDLDAEIALERLRAMREASP